MARKLDINSIYNDVKVAIDSISIGGINTIPVPYDLPVFRAYLTYIGKQEQKKFTTRQQGNNLVIMRIPYHNIQATINEAV